ncbi:hypothetical protein D7Z26_10345 [Cohnella endophytica]|uniref:Uncharacterized protein n=1 Tax=Cohnella endophytica TaxID=2419778 RepID=A0A494Y2B9_9BACL|nr:hypothetical protein [Cohnella endophytica]RKP55573.1 hypothetical protein D7Z26_10345 [Cohnella endophytica]
MKNSINKYLYYIGVAIFLSFFVFVTVSNLFVKTQYTLIVYDNTASSGFQIEGLKDPNHRISGRSSGIPGLGIPDIRIKVLQTPLYVLIKQKNQKIEFVTDQISELNDYLLNEIK